MLRLRICQIVAVSFAFCVFTSGVQAQNPDSIFNLKNYERTIALGDEYREAIRNNKAEKAIKLKTWVRQNGTKAEKLFLEKIEKQAPLWKADDKGKLFALEAEYLSKFRTAKDNLLTGESYIGLANYYQSRGLHNQALENYMYAFDELSKDPEGKFYRQSWYLYLIANSYYEFKDYEKVIRIATTIETLGARFSMNSSWFVVVNPNLAGMAYLRKDDYDSARIWLQKTYDRAIEMKNNIWMGIAGGNIGNTYHLQKKYAEAVPYYIAAIDTCTHYSIWDNVSPFCSDLADCFMHLGRIELVPSVLKKAEKANQLDRRADNLNKYYSVASSYYKIAGNYQLAFLYDDSAKLYKQRLDAEYDIVKKASTESGWAYHKSKLEDEVALQKAKREKLILYGLLAAAGLLLVIGILYYKRQRLRFLLKQEHMEVERLQMEESLEIAKIQLNDFKENIYQKNVLIDRFTEEIEKLKQHNVSVSAEQMESIESLKQAVILTDRDWDGFKQIFEKVYPGFLLRMKKKHPDLTPAETRYMVFTKMDLSSKEMGAMLGISNEAVRNIRFRVRKKLKLEENQTLEELLKDL